MRWRESNTMDRRMLEPTYSLVYASMLPGLRDVAREHGYALAVHGSMATDLDLVACPWSDGASDADTLFRAICDSAAAYAPETRFESTDDPNPSPRPHGRLAYALHFNHRRHKDLPHGGPYIDLSIMPRIQDR